MLDPTPTHSLWLYFLLVTGIVLLPGMDMAFVMASALAGGRRAGAAAVGGIVAGGVIHVGLSALGLGLVLLSAPRLFNALLVAGSLYIAWLGVSLLRGANALGEVSLAAPRAAGSVFGRALVTCLVNPKAYVFMLAVFPQFLLTERGSMMEQALRLSAITACVQAAVYGCVGLGSAGLGRWLRTHTNAQIATGRGVGGLLLLMALWTAWHGWQASG